MKHMILVLLMIAAGALIAADQPAPRKIKPAPAKATAKTEKITIPNGAVEIAPYTYRYTDAQGKSWIYRQTPFGVSRGEDKPPSQEDLKKNEEQKARVIAAISAVEDADYIRFQRTGAFGKTNWRKKKSELNEIESAAWNRELAKRDTAAKD